MYNYRIQPNYCIYPYKHMVKQFCSLWITARVLFVYFFIKAYVQGTNSNCIDLSMQFKCIARVDAIQISTHNICFFFIDFVGYKMKSFIAGWDDDGLVFYILFNII